MANKKKLITKRSKKKPVHMLGADSMGDERIAYELINLFAGAMRGLNDGAIPIPKHWENYLSSLICPEGSRKKPSALVRRKNVELAKSVITKKIDARSSKHRPLLKNAENAPDSKNIHRKISPVMGDAKLELLAENKRKRIDEEHRICCEEIASIQDRINRGESGWDIFREKFSDKTTTAMYRHLIKNEPLVAPHKEVVLSERDKAIRWMSDGMNLHIYPVHRDFAVSLEHPEDMAVVATSAGKNKLPNP